MGAQHHVTCNSSRFYRICNNTHQHSQRQDQALKILYHDLCSKICFSLDAMTHILHSPSALSPSFLVTQANFLLKCSGCRFTFLNPVFMDFILQPVLTGTVPDDTNGAASTRTVRLASLEAGTAGREEVYSSSLAKCLLFNDRLPRSPQHTTKQETFPQVVQHYTASQESHLSPHGTNCITGQ